MNEVFKKEWELYTAAGKPSAVSRVGEAGLAEGL